MSPVQNEPDTAGAHGLSTEGDVSPVRNRLLRIRPGWTLGAWLALLVETPSQLDFLRNHGCDEVQGFLCGRPEAADRARMRMNPVTAGGF